MFQGIELSWRCRFSVFDQLEYGKDIDPQDITNSVSYGKRHQGVGIQDPTTLVIDRCCRPGKGSINSAISKSLTSTCLGKYQFSEH